MNVYVAMVNDGNSDEPNVVRGVFRTSAAAKQSFIDEPIFVDVDTSNPAVFPLIWEGDDARSTAQVLDASIEILRIELGDWTFYTVAF